MKDLMEKILPEIKDEDVVVLIHDSKELEQELQQWIQQEVKRILAVI